MAVRAFLLVVVGPSDGLGWVDESMGRCSQVTFVSLVCIWRTCYMKLDKWFDNHHVSSANKGIGICKTGGDRFRDFDSYGCAERR